METEGDGNGEIEVFGLDVKVIKCESREVGEGSKEGQGEGVRDVVRGGFAAQRGPEREFQGAEVGAASLDHIEDRGEKLHVSVPVLVIRRSDAERLDVWCEPENVRDGDGHNEAIEGIGRVI